MTMARIAIQAPAVKKYPVLMHGGLNFTAYSKTATNALKDVGALIREELK